MFAKTGPVVYIDSVSAAVPSPNLAVGYAGGFAGISADSRTYSDAGYMIAALSNSGGGAQPVSKKIQNLVGRKG